MTEIARQQNSCAVALVNHPPPRPPRPSTIGLLVQQQQLFNGNYKYYFRQVFVARISLYLLGALIACRSENVGNARHLPRFFSLVYVFLLVFPWGSAHVLFFTAANAAYA